MPSLQQLLSGTDLRSVGKSGQVISKIKSQKDFDSLFRFLFHSNRIIVMHAADAIEKITIEKPYYLNKHGKALLKLFYTAEHKELKWHLALTIPRLPMGKKLFGKVYDALTKWAKDKTNSRLVRVGAVQGLYEMAKKQNSLMEDLYHTMTELEKENIPSVNARIKNIRKEIEKNKK